MASNTRRTLTVSIETHAESRARSMEAAAAIDAGGGYQGEFYSFANMSLLLRVFSDKRIALLTRLQELGPSTLRGLARSLGRDVKRVHEDAEVLLTEGIIERDGKNRLFVPFDRISIRAEFETPTAADAA